MIHELELPLRKGTITHVVGGGIGNQINEGLPDIEQVRYNFDHQKFYSAERAKTSQEQEVIEGILASMPEFLASYNRRAIDLTPDHIHLIDPRLITPPRLRKQAVSSWGGKFSTNTQGIFVMGNEGLLDLAQNATHEILHENSFSSATNRDGRQYQRRTGMRIYSPFSALEGDYDPVGTEYEEMRIYDPVSGRNAQLSQVDEAVIEELTKEFDQTFFRRIPGLKNELDLREAYVNVIGPIFGEIDGEDVAWVIETETSGRDKRYKKGFYEYSLERIALGMLIQSLRYKGKDIVYSKRDIFKLFADGTLNGRLLPLARLLNSKFGMGSLTTLTLESMGEIDENAKIWTTKYH